MRRSRTRKLAFESALGPHEGSHGTRKLRLSSRSSAHWLQSDILGGRRMRRSVITRGPFPSRDSFSSIHAASLCHPDLVEAGRDPLERSQISNRSERCDGGCHAEEEPPGEIFYILKADRVDALTYLRRR